MARLLPSWFAPAVCSCVSLTLSAASPTVVEAAPDQKYFEFDAADEIIPAILSGNDNHHEAHLQMVDGQLWMTWLEFVPGQGDHICLARRQGQEWVDKRRFTREPGRFARPTLTADALGRLWLSFECEMDGQWDVFAVRVHGDGGFGEPRAISRGSGPDINHRAAAAPDGGLWVVWQGQRGERFEILARRIEGGEMSAVFPVSNQLQAASGNAWQPDVTVTGDGTVFVVWDEYDGESYNVRARARWDETWTDIVDVASTPAFEGRAVLASRGVPLSALQRAEAPPGESETGNRQSEMVWVAWEEGELNWGRPYRARLVARPVRTVQMNDDRGPLNRFRRIGIGMLECSPADQVVVRHLKQTLPMPAMEAAIRRSTVPAGVAAMGAFYAAPQLTVDASGRLWIVYRQRYAPWMGIDPNHHIDEGWGLYARCLTSDGWSDLFRFDHGQGDGMQRIAVIPHETGIAAAWTTGRMDRRKGLPPRGSAVAFVNPPDQEGSPISDFRFPIQENAAPPIGNRKSEIGNPKPAPATIAGRNYHLVFGDLHRHTDLSLCFVPSDGTIEDAYRYALDVAGLDFLGITDHTHDLAWGDGLSMVWWRSTREVLRHEIAPRFFPIHAYERSRGDTDHNVISLRPDVLRPHTYPHPQFWKELDSDTFTIPHQPFNRATFESQDDDRRPLLEIYQGLRDVSVEEDAHAGLDRGYRFGFIASSDHLSTSASYAGVWVEERTRENIFRSLQARRTFGATDRIRLLVRAGAYMMGEPFTAAMCPPLDVEIDGTADIESVELIVDGHVREMRNPSGRTAVFTWAPPELPAGPHYLYVRLRQTDGNQAWSSPIWVMIED